MTSKRVGCLREDDFNYVADYYRKRVVVLRDLSSQAREFSEYRSIGSEAFYLQGFIDDMTHFGYPEITVGLEQTLSEEFDNGKILRFLVLETIRKIVATSNGQCKVGENSYILKNGAIYYRTLKGRWYIIDPFDVYLLLPHLTDPVDSQLVPELEKEYKPTEIDSLFQKWQGADFINKIDKTQTLTVSGVTTPDHYYSLALKQIKSIVEAPPSLKAVEASHGEGENYLESLFKISYKIINFVKQLKGRNGYPVYLLRDGMLFSDAHTALNFLQNTSEPQAQLMIGRKLLSTATEPEKYWRLVVDVLYSALKKYPADHSLFAAEYAKQMRKAEKQNPELAERLVQLASYIKDRLYSFNDPKREIIIVDTGLQGSLNMLVKYLIENYCLPKAKVDIFMFVVGRWFREVYKGKFATDYYPIMKDIEMMARSEDVYSYIPGSFEYGQLKVKMGDKNQQARANIELVILVTLCYLMERK